MRDIRVSEVGIDEVLSKTLDTLKTSQGEVWELASTVRGEYNRIRVEIVELRNEIQTWITAVDRLDKEFSKIRQRLFDVNVNFQKYSDEEKRKVYEEAERIREHRSVARERERSLRMRRDDLERSLVHVQHMVEKSEGLLNQLGVAFDFLSGNVAAVTEQVAQMQNRFALGQRIIRVQEEERKRLAREIHDGPAQDLANVVLKAEICERTYQSGDHEAALVELRELKTLVKASLQEVRKTIYNLRPMALDDLGLVPTVKRLLDEVQLQTRISARLVVYGKERRLEPSLEVALFRTIQEAVTNSKKHAAPREVIVKMEFLAQKVRVSIVDDGRGFDLQEAGTKLVEENHFGLYGMEERIQLLGGEWRIHSAPGKGTRIHVAMDTEEERR